MHNLRSVLTPNRWNRIFLISHICGWITAFVQTVWIVVEVRKAAKEIKQLLQKF